MIDIPASAGPTVARPEELARRLTTARENLDAGDVINLPARAAKTIVSNI
jgi:hypothetical protein